MTSEIAKIQGLTFTKLYNSICYIYHPGYKINKPFAYIQYREALAVIQTWDKLHPRNKVSFSELLRMALAEFNALHNTNITENQLTDDLTEIRKAL